MPTKKRRPPMFAVLAFKEMNIKIPDIAPIAKIPIRRFQRIMEGRAVPDKREIQAIKDIVANAEKYRRQPKPRQHPVILAKVCPFCKTEFNTIRASKVFCSDSCYQANYRMTHVDYFRNYAMTYRNKNKTRAPGNCGMAAKNSLQQGEVAISQR